MRKSVWLLSAGLVAVATPAFGPGAAGPTATPTIRRAAQPGRPKPRPSDQPREQQPVDTGDIVITAQGRRRSAVRTCRSRSPRSAARQLQNSGATDIRQLNQLAPSLLVSSTGTEANGSARIRGIGTVGDNPGLESSVAVFIDGVYRSRSGIGLNELGEIDRDRSAARPAGHPVRPQRLGRPDPIITAEAGVQPGGLWRS